MQNIKTQSAMNTESSADQCLNDKRRFICSHLVKHSVTFANVESCYHRPGMSPRGMPWQMDLIEEHCLLFVTWSS